MIWGLATPLLQLQLPDLKGIWVTRSWRSPPVLEVPFYSSPLPGNSHPANHSPHSQSSHSHFSLESASSTRTLNTLPHLLTVSLVPMRHHHFWGTFFEALNLGLYVSPGDSNNIPTTLYVLCLIVYIASSNGVQLVGRGLLSLSHSPSMGPGM